MIAFQPQPSPVLIMVNPYVETDEAQRFLEAWVEAKSRVSDISTLAQAQPPSDWLSRAYALGTEGEDDDIVFDMMSAVDAMLHADCFAEVDNILAQIKEQEVPLVIVEGLLRFCSRAQLRLPHWDRLKGRLIVEAGRRRDTEEITFTP